MRHAEVSSSSATSSSSAGSEPHSAARERSVAAKAAERLETVGAGAALAAHVWRVPEAPGDGEANEQRRANANEQASKEDGQEGAHAPEYRGNA